MARAVVPCPGNDTFLEAAAARMDVPFQVAASAVGSGDVRTPDNRYRARSAATSQTPQRHPALRRQLQGGDIRILEFQLGFVARQSPKFTKEFEAYCRRRGRRRSRGCGSADGRALRIWEEGGRVGRSPAGIKPGPQLSMISKKGLSELIRQPLLRSTGSVQG